MHSTMHICGQSEETWNRPRP